MNVSATIHAADLLDARLYDNTIRGSHQVQLSDDLYGYFTAADLFKLADLFLDLAGQVAERERAANQAALGGVE